MGYTLGFDIGGTNIKYAAVDCDRKLLTSGARETLDSSDARALWIETLARVIDNCSAKFGPVSGVGIAAPGLAARDGRSIAWMQGRMAAVQDLDWTDALHIGFDISVLNDSQAALLGEAWCGAAAGRTNVAMLTLGTGVGGACMVDGRLLIGAIGRAGHLGHISLDPNAARDIVNTPGSLEDAIGECTLPARSNGRFQHTTELLSAVDRGDAEAAAIWNRSLQCLACGIVSIINVVDPEVFILGGGIAGAGERLFGPLKCLLNSYEWRPTGTCVEVAQAMLGEYAGAYGAARNAAITSAA